MKLQGILGGGTGKLGESVFTNNAGRTIVRQYNPHVRNPRTARQTDSRGRFQCASSMAKVLAQGLAIGLPRIGALTSRNRFTKMAIPTANNMITHSQYGHEPNWENVKISKGGMPALGVSDLSFASGTHTLTIQLQSVYNPVAAGYVPPMPGKAGIVVVLLSQNHDKCKILQTSDLTNDTVSIVDASLDSSWGPVAFIFPKWVPEAYNDITATTMPWKFPSDQGESEYAEMHDA